MRGNSLKFPFIVVEMSSPICSDFPLLEINLSQHFRYNFVLSWWSFFGCLVLIIRDFIKSFMKVCFLNYRLIITILTNSSLITVIIQIIYIYFYYILMNKCVKIISNLKKYLNIKIIITKRISCFNYIIYHRLFLYNLLYFIHINLASFFSCILYYIFWLYILRTL